MLKKGRFYITQSDMAGRDKLARDLSGPMGAGDLQTASGLATALAAHRPDYRFEVREARNSRSVGPAQFSANGAQWAAHRSGAHTL